MSEKNKEKEKCNDREKARKDIMGSKLSGEKEAASCEEFEKPGDLEPMDICTVSTSLPCEIPSCDVMILEGHTSEVFACAWGPEGPLLASGMAAHATDEDVKIVETEKMLEVAGNATRRAEKGTPSGIPEYPFLPPPPLLPRGASLQDEYLLPLAIWQSFIGWIQLTISLQEQLQSLVGANLILMCMFTLDTFTLGRISYPVKFQLVFSILI